MDKKRIAMLKRMEELREADKRSRVLLVRNYENLSRHLYGLSYSLSSSHLEFDVVFISLFLNLQEEQRRISEERARVINEKQAALQFAQMEVRYIP